MTPNTGSIAPNGKAKLKVLFRPGIPERIEGEILVEIEQLSGEGIAFFGEGVFHHVTFSLPRVPHADFQKFLDEARRRNGQSELIEPSLAKFTKGPSSVSSEGTIRMHRDLRQVDYEVEAERMLIKDFVRKQEELQVIF